MTLMIDKKPMEVSVGIYDRIVRVMASYDGREFFVSIGHTQNGYVLTVTKGDVIVDGRRIFTWRNDQETLKEIYDAYRKAREAHVREICENRHSKDA